MKMKDIINLGKEAVSEWSADNASRLSAALSYYTVFSIAPLLVIILAIVGFVFGAEDGQGRVMQQLSGVVGPQIASMLQGLAQNAHRPSSGVIAGIIGIVVLIFGASGVFYELHASLNTIWDVQRKTEKGIMGVVKTRLSSFLIIFLVGFLMILALAASTAVSAFGHFAGETFPGTAYLLQAVNFVLSFVIIGVLFAIIFKTLPDAEVKWSDVWVGAAVTSILFVIGKTLIGLYLGKSTMASPYGAAGSLVILLAFFYYSAQIFFLGAEFTQIYANRFGSRILPAREGEAIPTEEPSAKTHPSHPSPEEMREGRAARGEGRGAEGGGIQPHQAPSPAYQAASEADRSALPPDVCEPQVKTAWTVVIASFVGGIFTGFFLHRPSKPA